MTDSQKRKRWRSRTDLLPWTKDGSNYQALLVYSNHLIWFYVKDNNKVCRLTSMVQLWTQRRRSSCYLAFWKLVNLAKLKIYKNLELFLREKSPEFCHFPVWGHVTWLTVSVSSDINSAAELIFNLIHLFILTDLI